MTNGNKKEKGQMTVAEAGHMGGQKGGQATKARHGRPFYEEIGHKGGQKVKRLIEEGEKREAGK